MSRQENYMKKVNILLVSLFKKETGIQESRGLMQC